MGRKNTDDGPGRDEVEALEELDLRLHEPGGRATAVVSEIRRGKLGALVDVERIRDPRVRERMETQRDRDAVQVCFELEGRRWCQTFLFSTSPRSNLYRLARKYGKLKTGTEVEVVFNSAGFPRIALD